MQKLKIKHIRFLFYLSIIIVITSCKESYEEDIDPCDYPYPQATGINNVTFTKTNGDTLQYINFGDVNEPCYSIGYQLNYSNSDKTRIRIHYNTYYNDDTEFFQVEPLFNGATSFEIQITLVDSTLSNQYEIDKLYINFSNRHYSYYNSINDTNTKIAITKYGDKFDKIEGNFVSTFINYYNNLDSLKIECQFSAVRWCDQ